MTREEIMQNIKPGKPFEYDNGEYYIQSRQLVFRCIEPYIAEDVVIYADIYKGSIDALRNCKTLKAPYLRKIDKEWVNTDHRGWIEEIDLPKLENLPSNLFENTRIRKARLDSCKRLGSGCLKNTNLEELYAPVCETYYSACLANTLLREIEVTGDVRIDTVMSFASYCGRLTKVIANGKDCGNKEYHPSLGRVAGQETAFNLSLQNSNNPSEYLEYIRNELLEKEDASTTLGVYNLLYGNDGLIYSLTADGKVALVGRWTENLLPDTLMTVAEVIDVQLLQFCEIYTLYAPFCVRCNLNRKLDDIIGIQIVKGHFDFMNTYALRQLVIPNCKKIDGIAWVHNLEEVEIGVDEIDFADFVLTAVTKLRVPKHCKVNMHFKNDNMPDLDIVRF